MTSVNLDVSEVLENIKELDYICAICTEYLVDPVNLPNCGHVFCQECVNQILFDSRISNFGSTSNPKIKCPICRSESRFHDRDTIKPNILLSQLIPMLEFDGYSDRVETYQTDRDQNEIMRSFILSEYCEKLVGEIGKYMSSLENGGATIKQTVRAMKKKFPERDNIVIEILLVLSKLLKNVIIIHNEYVIRKRAEDVTKYLTKHVKTISGSDAVLLLTPFTAININVDIKPSKLEKKLRSYWDNNRDKILEHISNAEWKSEESGMCIQIHSVPDANDNILNQMIQMMNSSER